MIVTMSQTIKSKDREALRQEEQALDHWKEYF